MIAYSEFSRDARIRRESEALIELGYNLDFFVLEEDNISQIDTSVNLIPLRLNQYRGDSNLKYISSYLNFFFQAFFKILWLYPKRKYRLIYTHNMPDFIVFIGLIPKLFGCKLIHDIHDLMPDIYRTKFKGSLSIMIYHLLRIQEQISCLLVDKVVTVHEPYKEKLVTEHKIRKHKIEVIRNIADNKLFNSKQRAIRNREETFTLLHHGTISERFGLDYIVKEFKYLIKEFPHLKLEIYGKGDGNTEINLKNLISDLKLNKQISLHGQVPLNEIPNIISKSDLGIISYKIDDSTDMFLPLKLLEYIAMEIPVLTISNNVIRYYFKDSELFFYENGKDGSFSKKLREILEDNSLLLGAKKEIKLLNKKFSWGEEKSKLQEVVLKLLMN
jgi:glycosyltransferase involved in cell wall biosynthesis